MSVDRRQANLQKLQEADDIQDKTKEAVLRIQRQAAATEEMAITSLDELRKQGQQMDEINSDLNVLSSKLDTSAALQNRFDRWAGNWIGGRKREALREARDEIALKGADGLSAVKEVFENEKYDSFSRAWRPSGMTLCANPTQEAPAVFDPALQEKNPDTTWLIDYSVSGVDAEGWTYAKDFAFLNNKNVGENSPKWNCFVRRRKWRYHDRKINSNDALSEVKERNHARATKKPQGGATGQVEKIGYIPRNKAVVLQESGATAGRGEDEDLDDESKAGLARLKEKDADIDASLGEVLRIVDNLDQIAGAMGQEVRNQDVKVAAIQDNLTIASNKQTTVNARQKKLLKTA